MKITIKNINEIKTVNKPWGYEKWIADGRPHFKYALKEIFIKKGFKSSLQFHEKKEESNFILSGTAILHYSDSKINLKKFLKNGYGEEEKNELISSIQTSNIVPGCVFHVKPLYLHRVEAITDLIMIESSTVELDDVYRLLDDTKRPHGKINNEHS